MLEDKWTQRPAALKLATDAEDLRTFKQNIAGSGGSTQVHRQGRRGPSFMLEQGVILENFKKC